MRDNNLVENLAASGQPNGTERPISYLEYRMKTFNEFEFVKDFPDPEKTFRDRTKWESSTYRWHMRVYLHNQFPHLVTTIVDEAIMSSGYSLTAANKKLQNIHKAQTSAKTKDRRIWLRISRPEQPMPDVVDEHFYDECIFIGNQSAIMDQVKAVTASMQSRVDEAKNTHQFQTCPCCFSDEVLSEHMLACPEGHKFCTTCIQRGIEVVLGDGKTCLACMDVNCSKTFAVATLREAVRPKTMAILERKIAEKEIKAAGIVLESCPFCPFACDKTECNVKLFQCHNEYCLKKSCRECKHSWHDPQPCETPSMEDAMRAFIENYITDATIRTCHQCGTKMKKDGGCNILRCPCGASMCYTCREPRDIHDKMGFYTTHSACLMMHEHTTHHEELKRAANEAKQIYIERHPEAAAISLDIAELLPNERPDLMPGLGDLRNERAMGMENMRPPGPDVQHQLDLYNASFYEKDSRLDDRTASESPTLDENCHLQALGVIPITERLSAQATLAQPQPSTSNEEASRYPGQHQREYDNGLSRLLRRTRTLDILPRIMSPLQRTSNDHASRDPGQLQRDNDDEASRLLQSRRQRVISSHSMAPPPRTSNDDASRNPGQRKRKHDDDASGLLQSRCQRAYNLSRSTPQPQRTSNGDASRHPGKRQREYDDDPSHLVGLQHIPQRVILLSSTTQPQRTANDQVSRSPGQPQREYDHEAPSLVQGIRRQRTYILSRSTPQLQRTSNDDASRDPGQHEREYDDEVSRLLQRSRRQRTYILSRSTPQPQRTSNDDASRDPGQHEREYDDEVSRLLQRSRRQRAYNSSRSPGQHKREYDDEAPSLVQGIRRQRTYILSRSTPQPQRTSNDDASRDPGQHEREYDDEASSFVQGIRRQRAYNSSRSPGQHERGYDDEVSRLLQRSRRQRAYILSRSPAQPQRTSNDDASRSPGQRQRAYDDDPSRSVGLQRIPHRDILPSSTAQPQITSTDVSLSTPLWLQSMHRQMAELADTQARMLAMVDSEGNQFSRIWARRDQRTSNDQGSPSPAQSQRARHQLALPQTSSRQSAPHSPEEERDI